MTDRGKTDLTDAFVLDTSGLMAVALQENDCKTYLSLMVKANTLHLSAVSRVELAIVAHNKNVAAEVQSLLTAMEVKIVAFDDTQATVAIAAFAQFGKGRHPAALNFGDCCAYALAKSLNLPLLYKGNDFAQTDITSALA